MNFHGDNFKASASGGVSHQGLCRQLSLKIERNFENFQFGSGLGRDTFCCAGGHSRFTEVLCCFSRGFRADQNITDDIINQVEKRLHINATAYNELVVERIQQLT